MSHKSFRNVLRFVSGLAAVGVIGLHTTGVFANSSEQTPGAAMPFLTVEAEDAANTTTGRVVRMTGLPTANKVTPEMEASGRAFVELAKTGDRLTIPITRPANTLVLRQCIPDAPKGGGQTATLSLYVNDKFRQSLTLSSKYNWLYGKGGENGQSNDPAAGEPHVFWDESRFFLKGAPLKPSDRIRLQKDDKDTAAFYRIDLADLEMVAPPPQKPDGLLSVIDFGANGSDNTDDSDAIIACIAAAKAQKKGVWIPAGTYYQSKKFEVEGVSVRGAGVWYTTIIGNVPETGFAGSLGFALRNDADVRDLSIDSAVCTSREMQGAKPFTALSSGITKWNVQNVWITHTNVGFWMSSVNNGKVYDCRVRNTYADGININRGSTGNYVYNNHVRGAGDDGIALLSENENGALPSKGNGVRCNTVIACWWGHNLDVAGGSGHRVNANLLADNPLFGCLAVNMPGSYPMYPLTDTYINDNIIVRGGGDYAYQRRGAIWIYLDKVDASVRIEQNKILQPIFSGIQITGNGILDITCADNDIDAPGQDAIVIQSSIKGKGTFTNNKVTKLKPGFRPFVHDPSAPFAVTQSGKSGEDTKTYPIHP